MDAISQFWDYLTDNAHEIAPGPGADNRGFVASEVVDELTFQLNCWRTTMEELCEGCKYPRECCQCW